MKTLFHELPPKYKSDLNRISNKTINKMYSNFNFLYLPNDHNHQLFNFLEKYKFITYKVNSLNDPSFCKAIICVEKKCIIIDSIEINILNSFFQANPSIINVDSSTSSDANDFLNHRNIVIKNNEFVNFTFHPIFRYLIDRFFYPSDYFEDQSFFKFKYSKEDEEKEEEENKKIEEQISNQFETNENRFKLIKNKINWNKKPKIFEFKENDFVNLRIINSGNKLSFSLSIHIETLYVFLVKKSNPTRNSHEIDFCEKYSHRCMTKFYGFIKKNGDIIGYVYEYMSKGTLNDRMKKPISELEAFTITNRIYQAIEYLHSNNLIHRDIKPSNVLFDHNNVPYLSDFDRIRNAEEDERTYDLGTPNYSSPEQDTNGKVTYATDIFSFGLVIYFLFEKKEIDQSYELKNKLIEFPSMTKGPKTIQKLYQSCVKLNQNERITKEDIYNVLYDEATIIQLFDDYDTNENIFVAIEYFYENLYLIFNDRNEKEKNEKLIYWYSKFYISYPKGKKKYDFSLFIFLFGILYCDIYGFKSNFSKSKKYFEIAAKLNHPKALLIIGQYYAEGKIYEKNIYKAKKYFKLSVRQNDSDGLLNLGKLYLNGDGIQTNISKAITYLTLSAEQNHPEALYILGYFYLKGKIVKQNITKAIEFFQKSAYYSNSNANLILGELYLYGIGVKKDYLEAKRYFEILANQNNSDALVKLGLIHYNGLGVRQDIFKAKEYFILAAKLQNSDGLYNLGCLYTDNFFKDYKKAFSCFVQSANLNNIDALFALGTLYLKGNGVKKDINKAIQIYKELASNNYLPALVNLGLIYKNGNGDKQNYQEAMQYFDMAAKLMNSKALINLSIFYLDGTHVLKNHERAIEYLKMAACLNDPDALLYLAEIYRFGVHFPKDLYKAKYFYEKAASLSSSHALLRLGDLYFSDEGIGKDLQIARKYYEKAAEMNNSKALLNLGYIYIKGLGVKKNSQKAKEYFVKSALLKNPKAYFFLSLFYEENCGTEKDFQMMIHYLKLSAELNYPEGLFYMGFYYSSGRFNDYDINKAIGYYKRCIQILYDEEYQEETNEYFIKISMSEINRYKYYACNNLGLIYINVFNDQVNCKYYLEQAAFAECPFAQNNFGLFYQIYLNDINNAIYMYQRASKHKLALAEFNIAENLLKEGKKEESIEYYIEASNHEDVLINYKNVVYCDERIENSKTFIICLTNLKLVQYYLLKNNYTESKKYFIKTFGKIINEYYPFLINVNIYETKNMFCDIKTMILAYPFFDFDDQNEFINQRKYFYGIIFYEPNALFDFATQNRILQNYFIREINEIIQKMNSILYKPPYLILFGQMKLKPMKQENKTNSNLQPANELFYKGLGELAFMLNDV